MVAPVFVEDATGQPADAPTFFVASRAHHADVGGMTPGSLPLATELVQEGLVIPPVRLYRGGTCNDDVRRLLLRNVRTPDERAGDLDAQRAAQSVGIRRLQALAETHGPSEATAYARHLQAYSARRTRAALADWPDGTYAFEDTLELEDGTHATLAVTTRIEDGGVTFDFEGTDPAYDGALNAVLSITRSACYYAVRCLVGEDVPANAGCFAPVRVTAPDGSLVHATPPHAVAGGNVETSQRIVDVVLGALAEALGDRVPAAAQGTMNNLTIGGRRADGTPFTYYETIGGGMGAASDTDGLSGRHVHMTNTRNTPVEALEQAYPFQVATYALRADSGGEGRHTGGDGVVREYRLAQPATVTLLSTRRTTQPWGQDGGADGAAGRNVAIRPDGSKEVLPAHFSRRFAAGTRLRIETPGGGGYGATGDSA
jgi:N-methylhydantoinase B